MAAVERAAARSGGRDRARPDGPRPDASPAPCRTAVVAPGAARSHRPGGRDRDGPSIGSAGGPGAGRALGARGLVEPGQPPLSAEPLMALPLSTLSQACHSVAEFVSEGLDAAS